MFSLLLAGFLTGDDATEGQHELSLFTGLSRHLPLAVGGQETLQGAPCQCQELRHFGLEREGYGKFEIRSETQGSCQAAAGLGVWLTPPRME